MCRHITILLPNRPGQFYKVASILSENKVNILGYALSSEGRPGVLYLFCHPHDLAHRVLSDVYSFYCTENEVLIVQVEHKPGSLKSILETIKNKKINLPNSYQGFTTDGNVFIVLEFDNLDNLHRAKEVLIENKFAVLEKSPS